jgi:hypothetical protein
MSQQRLVDETQILQMHEGQARQLLHMWQDGRVDLDTGEDSHGSHSIESALDALCDILDRSIRNRNQQIENIDNEPMDRFRRKEVR